MIRLYLASKIDSKFQKCPTLGGSLQNPAAFNQKGYYTKITQNDSVCLGFDAEVPQKILQGLYSVCTMQNLVAVKPIDPRLWQMHLPKLCLATLSQIEIYPTTK